MSTLIALIPWDTVTLTIFGSILYAWSQLKGSGALSNKGWKWQILTHIIDSTIQVTYDRFIAKYKKEGTKVPKNEQINAMLQAMESVRSMADKYGIDHKILARDSESSAELKSFIEARIANAKAGRKPPK